ncbi:hypothetical protein D3C81_2282270 [compost metagenome]
MLRILTKTPESPYIAFFIRGRVLLPTREYRLQNVEWNKEERTFKAEFAFNFLEGRHTLSSGKIDLRY